MAIIRSLQMSRPLLQAEPEIATDLMVQARDFAKGYITSNYKADSNAVNYVQNETLKAIFTIFLKLSYALFTLGLALSVQSGSLDQQRLILYIQEPRNKTFLIVLVLLAVSIVTILREVKEENKIEPATKKGFNFISDILRLTFYILSVVFIQPFIFDNQSDFILYVSFWVFLIALVFFGLRKIIKWYYYLGEGKKILGPWESKNITDEENVAKLTHLVNTYLTRKGLGGLIKASDKELKGKMQEMKVLQARLEDNIAERERLVMQYDNLGAHLS